MNIDLKIGWNDLNDKCKDTIKKLHKLGCKVNIIYPMIENEKHNNPVLINSGYDNREFNNVRTFTSTSNDFTYQDINSGNERISGAAG